MNHAGVLRQLGELCLEVPDEPRLLPVFIGIVKRVPKTMAESLYNARPPTQTAR